MLPVAGTMLLIIAGTSTAGHPVGSTARALGPFQFFGRISYSLYLWHWPILILIPLAVDAEPSVLLNVVLLHRRDRGRAAVSTSTSRSRSAIRGPSRRATCGACSPASPARSLGIAVVIAFTVVFVRAPSGDPVPAAEVEQSETVAQLQEQLSAALEVNTVPENLTPSLLEVENDQPAIYDNDCHLRKIETVQPDNCTYGVVDGDKTAVLFGDSHAAQWFPALEPIMERNGWRLIIRTKSACTPVSVSVEDEEIDDYYAQCDEWRGNVFEELDAIAPDLVILSSSEGPVLHGVDDADSAWLDGWQETLDRIQGAGAQVVAIADTPRSTESIPECVSLHMDSLQDCSIAQSEGIRLPERRADTMALQEAAGAVVIDPVDWFCTQGTCPVIAGDILMYRDAHHMTTHYAASLEGLLEDALPEL